MVVELTFWNILLIFIGLYIGFILFQKLINKLIEKFFPQWIKKCPICGEKYFETSNYCVHCGLHLIHLNDEEPTETIDVEVNDEE